MALVDARRPLPDLGVPTEAIRAPRGVPRLAWLELAVAPWVARHRGTLLHGAAYALPLRHRGPAVVTLHDVAWETHPTDFNRAKRQLWRLSARRSARSAGAVLTVSEFSKREIVATYGLDPADVLVAANAAGALFRPIPPPQAVGRGPAGAAQPAGGAGRSAVSPPQPPTGAPGSGGSRSREPGGPRPPSRYVVALGGAPRRDLPLAVDAWRRARAAPAPGGVGPSPAADVGLVVVGPERPPDEPGITWLGPVDDAVWASVLAGAEALLYPTSYEGYGMPAAEACASGVPVVCARVAALPEVLGDAAAWAPRRDAAAFASTLSDILADPARLQELAAAARARARTAPTWDDAADRTVEAYERAWRRRRGGRR